MLNIMKKNNNMRSTMQRPLLSNSDDVPVLNVWIVNKCIAMVIYLMGWLFRIEVSVPYLCEFDHHEQSQLLAISLFFNNNLMNQIKKNYTYHI